MREYNTEQPNEVDPQAAALKPDLEDIEKKNREAKALIVASRAVIDRILSDDSGVDQQEFLRKYEQRGCSI